MRARLEPKSVDVIVTSPPYNIGVKYNQYDDSISRDDYLQWLHEWAQICTEILSDEGSLFLNIGSKPSDPWVPFEVATVMRDVFQLQNVIHWIKSIYIENDSYGDKTSLSVGHYKPINSKRYVNDTHEYIFHFTKTGRVELDRLAIGVPYKDKSNVSRWQGAKADKRCRGNTWYIPYKTIQNRNTERPHPASFPPELVANCIRLHGLEKSALVLDPFMGIGNTALACIDLKIDCVGFELDKEYFDQACQQAMTRITLFD
ncbi:MAG: site-specific DNA-methyltransferase [Firmicutes bacterium]|nr:site-specific DNA-methyltransferase [Bacillota bacterium]